jgi:hypothetical protein
VKITQREQSEKQMDVLTSVTLQHPRKKKKENATKKRWLFPPNETLHQTLEKFGHLS